ncbi:MAG: alpha/beta hydrolase [Cyclobacteriaceae bacterium]
MIVYFISGLGADERAFRYIKLPSVEKRFIRWIPPLHNESLKEYTARLIVQIDTTRPVTLVGLSFGGIVAQAMAEIIACERVFLISCVKSPNELSWGLRLIRRTKMYGLLPLRGLKPLALRLAPYWFDAVSDRQKGLLKNIINDTDEVFARWAIGALMCWQGSRITAPLIHLHGTGDRIFPIRYVRNYTPIKGGGHFMVVTHARKISKLLQHHLNPVTL